MTGQKHDHSGNEDDGQIDISTLWTLTGNPFHRHCMCGKIIIFPHLCKMEEYLITYCSLKKT